MKHLMLDLETLGLKPGCGIIEIGWCLFSEDGKVSEGFEEIIPVEQNLLYGMSSEPDTIRWWLEAQRGLPQQSAKFAHITLPQTLSSVAAQWDALWFAGVEFLWAEGIIFDVSILKAAYSLLSVEEPIILRDENRRCWHDLRTLRHTYGWISYNTASAPYTLAHRAKQDALDQAQTAASLLKLMRKMSADAELTPTVSAEFSKYSSEAIEEISELKERLRKEVSNRLDRERKEKRKRNAPRQRKT